MKFKSRKTLFLGLIIWITSILLLSYSLIFYFQEGVNKEFFIFLSISLITVSFLLWILLDTYYEIKDNYLHYKSGPIFGKIEIDRIKKITTNKTMYVGLKPALATKGLIINYDRYSDIYISPVTPWLFIETLKKTNPNIIIEK